MMTIPEGYAPYKKTRIFDQETLPEGLRRAHTTRAGVWGKIIVLEGALEYVIEASPGERDEERHVLTPDVTGIVEPQVPHHVTPRGAVRVFVEFWRADTSG